MRFGALAVICGIAGGGMLLGCQPQAELASQTSAAASQDVAASQAEAKPATDSAEEATEAGEGPAAKGVELKLADLDQLQEAVANAAGQIVVVDVWSTSCAPCMREFPHLVELSQRFPGRVTCVSFNVDYIGLKSKPPESYRPAVEEFLQKQRATLTNLLSTATDEAVLTKFKLEAIPAILIYGPEGKLLHTLTDVNTGEDGLTYAGDVIPKVEELLAATK